VSYPGNFFRDFGNYQLGSNFGRMQIDSFVIDFDFVGPYFDDINPCEMDLNEMDNEDVLLPTYLKTRH
jgi:hypothetical protein